MLDALPTGHTECSLPTGFQGPLAVALEHIHEFTAHTSHGGMNKISVSFYE